MLPEKTERQLAQRNMDRATIARDMAERFGVGVLTAREIDHEAGIRENDASPEALAFFDELRQVDEQTAFRLLNKCDGDHNALLAAVGRIMPGPKSITVGGTDR